MSDIVERLEERANRMAELGSPRGELLTEARDEIVRLREERDEQAQLKWEAYDANKELTAERDRLRDLVRCLLDNEPDDVVADGGITVLMVWRQDARRALGLPPPPAPPAPEFDL